MSIREQIKEIVLLNQEITHLERTIYNPEIMEGGFVMFDKLRSQTTALYHTIFKDDKEYPVIEYIERLLDEKEEFNTNLLSPKQRKKHVKMVKQRTMKMWPNGPELEEEKEVESFFISKELKEENPHCIIKFKNLEEVLDYIEKEGYLKGL